jgi:hypothetical protein
MVIGNHYDRRSSLVEGICMGDRKPSVSVCCEVSDYGPPYHPSHVPQLWRVSPLYCVIDTPLGAALSESRASKDGSNTLWSRRLARRPSAMELEVSHLHPLGPPTALTALVEYASKAEERRAATA